MSDTEDTVDMDYDDSEDSPVIRKLRAELRQKEKALQDSQDKLAQVETAEQTRRNEAAEKLMDTIGLPGLKEDVLSWVEGPITEASVIEALKVRSIPLSDDFSSDAEQSQDEDDGTPSASTVGQRVADAAGGQDKRDLDRKIAEATSQEEINELMAEAGLTRSHS